MFDFEFLTSTFSTERKQGIKRVIKEKRKGRLGNIEKAKGRISMKRQENERHEEREELQQDISDQLSSTSIGPVYAFGSLLRDPLVSRPKE